MSNFSGLFATPVTAYDESGNIDPKGIRTLVEFVSENGVQNLFCLGSWGGFALMTNDERKKAAEAYLKASEDCGMPCIINVASTTQRDAINLAKHAEDFGASAVASLVPYYYSSSSYNEKNILNYFDELVSSTNVPVHLYNNPRTTGFNLNMQMFKSLLNVGISGMKDGGGNISMLTSMIDFINNEKIDFDLIPGTVSIMPITLLYGLKANMVGSSVVFPELAVSAWNAWHEGDITKFVQKHSILMKLRKVQETFGMGSASCYKLLSMRGVDIGVPRKPWIGLSDAQAKEISDTLKNMGLYL